MLLSPGLFDMILSLSFDWHYIAVLINFESWYYCAAVLVFLFVSLFCLTCASQCFNRHYYLTNIRVAISKPINTWSGFDVIDLILKVTFFVGKFLTPQHHFFVDNFSASTMATLGLLYNLRLVAFVHFFVNFDFIVQNLTDLLLIIRIILVRTVGISIRVKVFRVAIFMIKC